MVGDDVFRLMADGKPAASRAVADGGDHRLSDAAYGRRLALAFLAVWLALAVGPVDRADWMAENLLVAGLAVALWATRLTVPLSKASSTTLFAFLCLHEVGAHYTYPGVPYDAWFAALTGGTLEGALGLERNHFDRLVHLAFGLLLTQPIREVLMRTSPLRGRWTYWLAVAVSMAASSGYEVAEWWVAALFGGDLGAAFLGAQGDEWDAQKDMGLAALGAMLAMTVATNVDHTRERAAASSVRTAETRADGRPLTVP